MKIKGFKSVIEIDGGFYMITNLGHEFYLLDIDDKYEIRHLSDGFDFIDKSKPESHKSFLVALDRILIMSAIENLDIEQTA